MKLALCNEVLRHLSWDAQCQYAAVLGFDGLEIAPYSAGYVRGILGTLQ